MTDRQEQIVDAINQLGGKQLVTMNKVTVCDDVDRLLHIPRGNHPDSVSYEEIVAALKADFHAKIRAALKDVHWKPMLGKEVCILVRKCLGRPVGYGDILDAHKPTPNSSTPNIVQDHPRQRPGKWFAIVEINAEVTATAQEVRDAICDVVEVDFAEGAEHCLSGVSIRVERGFGLHPDEGSDENTVYWP